MSGVRMRDVATRAGVSTATVSLVLSGKTERISPQTARLVRDAAAELDYQPNATARSLRTSRTRTLALVSDEIITTPYANRMIVGAQEAAWEQEHLLFVVNTGSDVAYERELISSLRSRGVDGFLYAAMYHRRGEVPAGLEGQAVVGLDIELTAPARASFVPDEVSGAASAARLLLDAGHRRIGHVTDAAWLPAQQLRLEGFRRTLEEANAFDPALIVPLGDDALSGADQSGWGERATARLLDSERPPTAIFAYNDRMAIGVFRETAARGLRIPEDLSVVGFDNQELVANELRPRLTTVALPHRELGRLATRRLLEVVEDAPGRDGGVHTLDPVLVDCPLVIRESVGPPG